MGNSWIWLAASLTGKTGALCTGETTKSQIYTDPVLPRLSHTLRLHTATAWSSLCVRPTQTNSHCLTCSKLNVCFILNRCNNHKVLITLELLSAHEHVWLCVMCLCKHRIWDNKHRTSNCTGMNYNNQEKVYEDDMKTWASAGFHLMVHTEAKFFGKNNTSC